MRPLAEAASVTLRSAVANLLRLADAGLRDARVLMGNGSLRNAAMIASSAVSQMAAATVTPERGLPAGPSEAEPGELDGSNPVKPRLEELGRAFHQERGLDADGRLPEAPDETALRNQIERAAALLECLSKHFEVDLGSDAPAGALSPVRPMPLPAPAPRKPARQRPPGDAASKAASRAARPQRGTVPAAPGASPSPAAAPLPSASQLSSTVFWALMDRWGVPDLDALALLGHAGGLTQKGTRPRFRLTAAENEMMAQLQDVDGALSALGLDPRQWLREPLSGVPFSGADPITFITQHQVPGARELRHHILRQGLRLSLQR